MTMPNVTHPDRVDALMGKKRSPLPRRMQFAFINSEARYWTLAKYADLRQAERDGMYEDEKAVRMTWARIALMEFICGLPRGTGRQPYANGATDEIMRKGLAS